LKRCTGFKFGCLVNKKIREFLQTRGFKVFTSKNC
jgi:hypothetical protein